jgi:hypothetical protein
VVYPDIYSEPEQYKRRLREISIRSMLVIYTKSQRRGSHSHCKMEALTESVTAVLEGLVLGSLPRAPWWDAYEAGSFAGGFASQSPV